MPTLSRRDAGEGVSNVGWESNKRYLATGRRAQPTKIPAGCYAPTLGRPASAMAISSSG
jgi:hypothetical protein